MNILAERPDTLSAYDTAQKSFFGHVVGGPVLLVLVLLAPKPAEPASFRLALTAMFFLGAITAVWGFGPPLEAFLRSRLELSVDFQRDLTQGFH